MALVNQKTTVIFLLALFSMLKIEMGLAQSINTQKLDSYFNTLEVNQKFMGSVAILKDGKVIYNKQVGYSDMASKQKPNKETKYRIGSVSKLFTATLTFKAIKEGKISLNQTIEKYFPEIKNASSITISNLLNHRSGIRSFTDNKEAFLSYHTRPKTEKEMVEIITQGGSDFNPDEKAAYSNSNYVLLSYILEKFYKKPYARILEDEIVRPLNLNHTFFGSKIDVTNNECYAYQFEKQWKKTDETDPSIDMGAGGIVSTPTDLIHFTEALFNNKILSSESVSKMQIIQDKFGMGLFKIEYYNESSYGHNGEIDGFTSVLRYFPEKNIAFAITSNGLNYSLNSISVTIVNSLFNKHFEIPDFRVYEPKAKELEQYLGVYSSNTFPVKLTVTRSGSQLHLQAPGDSVMNLQAVEKGEFIYEPAGIAIVFDVQKNQMHISQGGKTNVLDKE
ncbi:serine hydrolase domain-containing protein [Gaetbulibacter jejuensis]|uniref:Serine hydrolase domain-containing protein n=1 Tax=Gaetbulibacter jejuensis TaxID=584607 RepID=A0ABP3VAY3_9FLAO